MTIGITGATGHLGRLVVGEMKRRVGADQVMAIARAPEKGADLGVTVRHGDYDDIATLVPAVRGVDTLLLISAPEIGKRAAQHQNVISAARDASVGRIVYTSILHADTSIIDLASEHRATEAAILASGLSYTILRNGWYTENYTGSIPGALAGGAWLGSAGDGRISSAARADYAAAAAVVLSTPGHEEKTYELAGDDAWTLADLAAEISRQTGRDIPYRNLPEAEYATTLTQFGVPEAMARAIAGWDVAASKDALYDDSRQLSSLIGRPTTPMADTVAEALKSV